MHATADRAMTPVSRAPSGVLRRKCACGGTPGPSGECAECRKKRLTGMQRKLRVGGADDRWEREADQAADRVTGTSGRGAAPLPRPTFTPLVQRRGEGEGTDAAPPIVHDVLASAGRPLDAATRSTMEARFGHDFGRVRVHTDARAAESARAVDARAYTAGSSIVFGEREYAPGTGSGRWLLAHELAHVVQQTGRLQRDFAIAPTAALTAASKLTDPQVADAIEYNSYRYFDAAEVELLRDVLGIAKRPAVIDKDFVLAVARYQQQFGQAIDGKLNQASAAALTKELTAEGVAGGATELGIRGRAVETAANVDSGGKNDIFDAELDHANARLTLKMRVQFRFKPGGGGPWPNAAAKLIWRDAFIPLVEGRWSHRILMQRQDASDKYLKYYSTVVSVEPSDTSPHYTVDVSYETASKRSDVTGKQGNFDSLDVDPVSYEFDDKTYTRTTAEHEFGHMLGLDHILCDGAAKRCYGENHNERRNIMGYGDDVSVTNSTPFVDAMRGITGLEWNAAPMRRLV